MKAKLILKHRGDYDYFLISRTDNSEALIASLTPDGELEEKLSKQNCDEIFGVVDVEKLANEEYREFPTNPKDKPDWHYNRDINCHRKRKAYIKGFNKHAELNKDKVFTVEDMQECWRASAYYSTNQSRINYESFIQSLQQPTEIEVEIEMEDVIQLKKRAGGITNMGKPKLDSNGCLILKRK